MMRDRFILKKIPYENLKPLHYLSVNQRIAVTSDFKGTAERLVEKLKQAGFPFVEIVENEVSSATDVLIDLAGLTDFKHLDAAIDCNRQVFKRAQSLAKRFSEKGGIYINIQSSAEEAVFSTGQAGLAKTAQQEWPKSHCLTIELEVQGNTPEALAERILQHILHDNITQECTILADGKKTTLQLVPHEAVAIGPLPIDKKSVILVSGGGRGITAACLIALAKACQPCIVLLGRTPLTEGPRDLNALHTLTDVRNALIAEYKQKQENITLAQVNQEATKILAQREIAKNLQTLKSLGSDAHYFATDILSFSALQQTIDQVQRQVGPITGLIHGAGVLADKLIKQKSMQQFDQVFNTKIVGLHNLLRATAKSPLSVLLFFSSVAARFGNPGQSDYAMANDILNKVAEQEQRTRGKACFVKSFNWGPWETGMVTPELKVLFKQRGIGLLSLERGTQLFIDELKNNAPSMVQVILGGRLDTSVKETVYTVNEKSHGFLMGHTVEKIPVLPAALVLEWFYQMIASYALDLHRGACRNFKVLSGVRLNHFFTAHDELKVVAGPQTEEKIIPLKLIGANGTLHYSAEWVPFSGSPVFRAQPLAGHDGAWPWQTENIYEISPEKRSKHQLFHGEDFQAIKTLQGFSELGGEGQLLTLSQKNWRNGLFKTDVLIVDGVLQLLRLWSFTQLNYPTLPTKINEFILYRALPAETDTLSCTFTSQGQGKYRTISNAWLHDQNGQLYIYLNGIEMCAVQIN